MKSLHFTPRRHKHIVDTAHLLSSSFTPIVLISACGLITPSLYSRLGDISARIRAIHHQKIDLLKNHQDHDIEEMEMLLSMLDFQDEYVIEKARIVKRSLYCLLWSIASFLFCSVFAGASEISIWVGRAALATGILGVCLFLTGLGWAIKELSMSLAPLKEEKEHLRTVTAHYLERSRNGTRLKAAKSA